MRDYLDVSHHLRSLAIQISDYSNIPQLITSWDQAFTLDHCDFRI